MKKLLILPMLIGLCACKEQPITDFELSQCCGHTGHVQIYDDYVMLEIDGGVVKKLPRTSQVQNIWEYGGVSDWGLEVKVNPGYGGIDQVALRAPESENLARCFCNASVPIVEKNVLLKCLEYKVNLELHDGYVMLSVDDSEYKKLPFVKKLKHGSMRYGDDSWFWIEISEFNGVMDVVLRDEYNWGNGCNQLIPIKGLSANETENCIAYITEEVSQWEKELVVKQQIRVDNRPDKPMGLQTKYHYISADDAKQLSPNWDFSDMKRYDLSDGVQEYEQDACEVLEKLRQYKHEHGLKKGLIHVYPDGTSPKYVIE